MVFFLEKKQPKREYVPVDLVQRMSSQGVPQNVIAGKLQSQGFSSRQIDSAMRILLREGVGGPQRTPPRPRMPPSGAPGPEPIGRPQRAPPVERYTRGPEPMGAPMERAPLPQRREQFSTPERLPQPMRPPEKLAMPPEYTFTKDTPKFEQPEITLEEIIEGVVADKWDDFEERLNIYDKKNLQVQDQIKELREQVGEMTKILNQKEQTLISRFEAVSGSMDSIEGRIGSIERIFKEFIPDLTENIRLLSEMAEKKK